MPSAAKQAPGHCDANVFQSIRMMLSPGLSRAASSALLFAAHERLAWTLSMITLGTVLSGARSASSVSASNGPFVPRWMIDRIAEQVRLTELLEDRHHVDHLAADVGVHRVSAVGQHARRAEHHRVADGEVVDRLGGQGRGRRRGAGRRRGGRLDRAGDGIGRSSPVASSRWERPAVPSCPPCRWMHRCCRECPRATACSARPRRASPRPRSASARRDRAGSRRPPAAAGTRPPSSPSLGAGRDCRAGGGRPTTPRTRGAGSASRGTGTTAR